MAVIATAKGRGNRRTSDLSYLTEGGIAPPLPPSVPLTLDEIVNLAAVDSNFFASHFFPKTFRQESPPFQHDIWDLLESPDRFVQAMCFRGSGKTTIARTYAAKRIAYGISKTILYVSASEAHSIRSVQWLRGQIERNKNFATTFGLSPGLKWSENECQIQSSATGQTAWVFGAGATGNIRGINFDDYRPDLIIIDDLQNDETSYTEEQRKKLIDLVYSALMFSLAPASEEPSAKIIMLDTPLNQEDVTQHILKDPMWRTVVFPCWTKETWDLPIEDQYSAWEARYPTVELRATKRAHIASNTLTKFLRESECRIVSSETAVFKPEWIKEFGLGCEQGEPKGGMCVLAVDPVPPPSNLEKARDFQGKNYEAILVVRRAQGAFFVEEYSMKRGHEPNFTIAKIFELAHKYRVSRIIIESYGYQKVLGTLVESEMRRRGIYYPLVEKKDRRSKFNRIISCVAGPLSQGKLFIRRSMTELIEQITSYPSVKYDDLLDAASLAIDDLNSPHMDLGESEYAVLDETMYPDLDYAGGAP